jgi:hypothetical protein
MAPPTPPAASPPQGVALAAWRSQFRGALGWGPSILGLSFLTAFFVF